MGEMGPGGKRKAHKITLTLTMSLKAIAEKVNPEQCMLFAIKKKKIH